MVESKEEPMVAYYEEKHRRDASESLHELLDFTDVRRISENLLQIIRFM